MRILITNHFPLRGSGSGIYTLNIAKVLTEKGFDVTVISPDITTEENKNYPFEVRNIIFRRNAEQEKFDLDFNFPCFTTHPLSTNTFYDLADEQLQAYLLAFQGLIHTTVKQKDIQVFHGQHIWLLSQLAFNESLPGVVTCHGTDLMGYNRAPNFREYCDDVVRMASFVITVSEQTTGQFVDAFPVATEKAVTILNGFDPDIFKPQSVSREDIFDQFELPHTKKLVSFSGKLAHFKGIDVLIKAAAKYEQECDATTVVMGDGELRGELEALKNELGLKHFHFLGHQTQHDMAKVMAAADVAVTPSRKEPFGLVAIEALACGTPVVVSDDGGLKEFITDKEGSVFVSEDAEDLAAKIASELVNNTKQVKGTHGAAYALKHFGWEEVVDKTIELYQKALK